MNPDLTNQQQFKAEDPNNDSAGEDSDNEKPARRSGRRKIKIEYIEDKNRRHITFSKRKAGIMKKAYELSTLTGTQVLLLVVSETGLVYTFTTVKLQPIVTKPEGKNLIQACLNAPDPVSNEQGGGDASYGNTSPQVEDKYEDTKPEPSTSQQPPQQQQTQPPPPQNAPSYGGNGSNNAYQAPYPPPPQPNNNNYTGYPSYMSSQSGGGYPTQQPPPPQQTSYNQMPQPYYSQPPQQPSYWQQNSNNPALQQRQSPIIDDKTKK